MDNDGSANDYLGTRQGCFITSDPAKPVHQQAVPAVDARPRRRLVDSRSGNLEQCGDGELLLLAEDRMNSPQDTATAMTLERFYSQNAGTRRLAISVLWSLRGRRD